MTRTANASTCPRCSSDGGRVRAHVETEHTDRVSMTSVVLDDVQDLADMMMCQWCKMVWFEILEEDPK